MASASSVRTPVAATAPPSGTVGRRPGPGVTTIIGRAAFWITIAFFLLNVLVLILAVVVQSFSFRWYGSFLPSQWTISRTWGSLNQLLLGTSLFQVVINTLEVVLSVILLSLLLGVPAAYALARRKFPGRGIVYLLFLFPVMLPPIAYVIPLVTVLDRLGPLSQTLGAVIIANLVPSVAFVVLVMVPFVEQIDPNLEAAARMLGARPLSVFRRVLVPLLIPGLLAAGVLVLVRTIAQFELTFFPAGPQNNTLVVAIFSAQQGTHGASFSIIACVAVIYMLTTLVVLIPAFRFIDPTQLVTQLKERPTK
jgi:putative spermidine/putrescine transport system permease protein